MALKRAGGKWFPGSTICANLQSICARYAAHRRARCVQKGRTRRRHGFDERIYPNKAPSARIERMPAAPATAEPPVCSLYACETVMPENWLTTQK